MDPLTKLLREIAEGIASLSDTTSGLILRALFFYGVTTGLAAWAFHRGSRSQFVQVMAFTLGFLVAAFLPLDWLIPTHPMPRAAFLVLALVALAFLPAYLPFYLTPNILHQRRIRLASYALLAGFFALLLR